MVCKATSTPVNGSLAGGDGSYLLDRSLTGDGAPLASLKVVNGRYGFQKRMDNGSGLGGPVSVTPLSSASACFRRSFDFGGDPSRVTLELDHTVADGAVFHLNGVEISRANMPGGPVTHGSNALARIPVPAACGFADVPSNALVTGTNVLAVLLHSTADSGKLFFGPGLRAVEAPFDLGQEPPLVINEIAASGAATFFVELLNPHDRPVSMKGFAAEVPGGVMALPASVVAPGALVHFTEAQLGFRATAGARVVLSSPDGTAADIQLADSAARERSADWPGRWLLHSGSVHSLPGCHVLISALFITELQTGSRVPGSSKATSTGHS